MSDGETQNIGVPEHVGEPEGHPASMDPDGVPGEPATESTPDGGASDEIVPDDGGPTPWEGPTTTTDDVPEFLTGGVLWQREGAAVSGVLVGPDDFPLVTKTGRELTKEDVDALADEAEAGYDVEHLKGAPDRRDLGRGVVPADQRANQPGTPPVTGGLDLEGLGAAPDVDEPPVDVGMMVRMERRGEEVPALVMAVYDGDAIDCLVFSMIGPAFVRPMERIMRSTPGNGGWWPDWESET